MHRSLYIGIARFVLDLRWRKIVHSMIMWTTAYQGRRSRRLSKVLRVMFRLSLWLHRRHESEERRNHRIRDRNGCSFRDDISIVHTILVPAEPGSSCSPGQLAGVGTVSLLRIFSERLTAWQPPCNSHPALDAGHGGIASNTDMTDASSLSERSDQSDLHDLITRNNHPFPTVNTYPFSRPPS